MSEFALEAKGLTKRWGDFCANENIDIQLRKGERHALIGPNGAGKTTLVHMLTGYIKPTQGDVYLSGRRLTHIEPSRRARLGMARTFQINRLFSEMTVADSVLLSVMEARNEGGVWWRSAHSMRDSLARVETLLSQLRLKDVANRKTGELPYGRQRIVEIALALSGDPAVLLLDEPAAGIPAEDSRELFNVIDGLPKDVTIVIIEHDMELVFRFAESITVLVGGKVLMRGTPADVAQDRRVKEVYLGETVDD